jgi:hypothetical protein
MEDKRMKQLTELTHLLLCNLPHSEGTPENLDDRQEGVCYFTQEGTMSDAMSHPDHQKWKRVAEGLIIELQASSPQHCYDTLLKLSGIIQQVNQLTPNPDIVWKLIFKIL